MANNVLGDFFKAIAEEKKKQEEAAKPKVDINSLDLNIKEAVEQMYQDLAGDAQPIESFILEPEPIQEILSDEVEYNEPSLVETTLDILRGTNDPGNPDPLTPTNQQFVTLQDFNKHYNTFVERVQQQLSTIGGGGEVDFRYLDDVERSTMTASNDNWLLEYDAASGHVKFTDSIGPISTITFDVNHVDDHTAPGLIAWSNADQTLNIHHPGGPVQQVGQETYGYVRNKTGVTITNGQAVGFAGAEQNGEARLLVSPFIANNTFPTLYGFGIATQDIPDGEDGRITVWGKVRDVDTSAFNVGDILYVSPTDSGGLTNIRPTSPNNVIPMAAVLSSDSAGELFVRPSFEQQKNYGSFSSSLSQQLNAADSAQEITLNTAAFSQKMEIVDGKKIRINEPGLYSFAMNAQLKSTNASSKNVYFWIRKNDSDVPLSTRILSLDGNDIFSTITSLHNVSLNTGDTVTHMFAASDAAVSLNAPSSTTFAPASPSVIIEVDQSAL